MKKKTSSFPSFKKASFFLPVFFIWLFIYGIVDYFFKVFHIKDTIFYPLDYGYDFSLKIVVSFLFQSVVLGFLFHKFSKEHIFLSFLRASIVSGFLFMFLYILITGIYMRM